MTMTMESIAAHNKLSVDSILLSSHSVLRVLLQLEQTLFFLVSLWLPGLSIALIIAFTNNFIAVCRFGCG